MWCWRKKVLGGRWRASFEAVARVEDEVQKLVRAGANWKPNSVYEIRGPREFNSWTRLVGFLMFPPLHGPS